MGGAGDGTACELQFVHGKTLLHFNLYHHGPAADWRVIHRMMVVGPCRLRLIQQSLGSWLCPSG